MTYAPLSRPAALLLVLIIAASSPVPSAGHPALGSAGHSPLRGAAPAARFTNPLLSAPDPWMIYWHGAYYYTGTTGSNVSVWKSSTITGLSTAVPVVVWAPPTIGPNSSEIWSPQIHYINHTWYIYYTADDGDNKDHRMFVLQGDSQDPQGAYHEARTGYPHGQLDERPDPNCTGSPSGCWAIAGQVFQTRTGAMYILWSGTENQTASFPQNIYGAPMRDPLHIGGRKVLISTPTRDWERRGAAIDEGPMVIQRGGKTFVVYSGSASWTNSYDLGLLTNTDGRLLDARSWTKTGPIFESRPGICGPGGFTTAPSPDGTQDWFLYHAAVSCGSGWTRDVRAQRLYWNPDGSPLLGYPIPESVPLAVPSGDNGPYGWGAALSGAAVAGMWSYGSPSNATNTSVTPRQRVFRGDGALFDYVVRAEVRQVRAGAGQAAARYGLYALYRDEKNYVMAVLDPAHGAYATYGVVGGVTRGWRATALPRGFDAARYHALRVVKADTTFQFYLDGARQQARAFDLTSGQVGLVTENVAVSYRLVAVDDTSQGWGNSFGDARAGSGGGLKTGDWTIAGAASVTSAGRGSGWMSLYRGNPNDESYTVSATTHWLGTAAGATAAGATAAGTPSMYGLYACYSDSKNYVVALLDHTRRMYSTYAVAGGVAQAWQRMALPRGFDLARDHVLAARKAGNAFTFYLDGVPVQRRDARILNGQIGVVTDNARVRYQGVAVSNTD